MWRQWARDALAKLDSLEVKPEGSEEARRSLEHTEAMGLEPYYTLKIFVALELGMDT